MKSIFPLPNSNKAENSSKRKPIFCAFLLLFFNFAMAPPSIGQEAKSLILAHPGQTQGYIVLQKTDPRITHYSVIINKLTYATSGEVTKLPVNKIELWNLNYWQIPAEYIFQTEAIYSVEVHGQGSGNIVYDSDEEPLPMDCADCPEGLYSSYECESYTTSFEIGISFFGSNGNYVVERGNAYMWFSTEDLASIYSGGVPGYEPINNYAEFVAQQGALTNVPNNPSQPGGTLHRRMDGTFIPDAFPIVYGLPKTKYEWCGTSPQAGAMQLSSLPVDLSQAMSEINESNSWDCNELYCNEMFDIGWDPDSEEGEDPWDDWHDEWEEWEAEIWESKFPAGINPDQDEDGDGDIDFWDDLIQHLEAYANASGNTDFTINQVDYINIKAFNQDGIEQLLQYQKSDLIDATGTPTPPSFTLEEGIYEISFTVGSGMVFRYFLPVKTRLISDFSLSSYLSMLAFPVPVQGQQFQLNIQSAANLGLRLEINTMDGTVYYQNKYELGAGHNQNHDITLAENTPEGVLIVRLIFSDGSQKTVNIIKQRN